MLSGLRQKTMVKSGGVVEICSPELPTGATVEVIVLVDLPFEESKRSLSSFIGSAKGSFCTPEEVDRFIRQERDQWEF